MKRYANAALVYALPGGHGWRRILPRVYQIPGLYRQDRPVGGAYPLLPAGQVLLALLLEKSFGFTGERTGRAVALYHVGLNRYRRGPFRPGPGPSAEPVPVLRR